MARLAVPLRRPRRPELPDHPRRGERGATLTEYGLIVALVVVASLGGIMQLQDESGSYLVQTGSDVGQPRELAAEMSADLPEEPDWLPQPPAPTTTTTAPTTTTSTVATSVSTTDTTAATSTTADPTSTTAATTTTTTASTTTTTTAASYPVGAVIYDGPMYSQRHTGDCYQIENSGQVNSSTGRYSCNGNNNQKIQAVGSATQVAIRWKSISAGHCLTADNTTNRMTVCGPANAQQYTVTVDGSGWITFKNVDNNLCLAEHSSGLELETCSSGSDRQKFKFS
ncbi:MAG: ricin-type beta-trefoil lectin domain protein [Acidimicrobiales bacterium]